MISPRRPPHSLFTDITHRAVLVVAAIAWLGGCTTVPVVPELGQPDSPEWQARHQRLTALTDWQLRGRLAVRAGDEGGQANLRWRLRGDRHNIDLNGPFGAGHVRLTQEPGSARLLDSSRQTYYASTAQELLLHTLGWDVPFDYLNFWVRGLPAPQLPARWHLDADARLDTLEQDGWRVQYLAYARFGDYELPSKLYITRDGVRPVTHGADQAVEVRLAIAAWDLDPND